MSEENLRAAATALIELVREETPLPRFHAVPHPEDPSKSITVVTKEHALVSVKALQDEHRTRPERRTGTAAFLELGSFTAHVVRFADKESAIFADKGRGTNPAFTAVLDYHPGGAGSAPRFGTHRATYAPPLSEEWQAWKALDGKWVGQNEFSAFLEDRVLDVVSVATPKAGTLVERFKTALGVKFADAAALMALARGLDVVVDMKVSVAKKLSSGEAQISFSEEHKAAGGQEALNVPAAFVIGIPVFQAGQAYQLPVRLRYRIDKNEGALAWCLDIFRPDIVFDDAFTGLRSSIAEATQLAVWVGAPERH
jgi:uncharacterized protein YfdQ (DUF2303 family)